MGFLDDVEGLAGKAEKLAEGHEDQVKSAVEKAGDLIDSKTDGKFAGQVDKGQELIEGKLGAD